MKENIFVKFDQKQLEVMTEALELFCKENGASSVPFMKAQVETAWSLYGQASVLQTAPNSRNGSHFSDLAQ